MAASRQLGLVSLAHHMLNSGVDRAALQRVLLNVPAQADAERSGEQVAAAKPTTAGDRRKSVNGESKASANAAAPTASPSKVTPPRSSQRSHVAAVPTGPVTTLT